MLVFSKHTEHSVFIIPSAIDFTKSVMYQKSKVTINNILEAARSLFVEKNYADVTILEIVTRAEVSKGALYHHFSSKEDLYLKMMHYFLEQIEETTHAAAVNSSGTCQERLYQSTFSFLQLPDELLGILRLVRRDINIFTNPMRDELVRAYQRTVPEQVEYIIRDCIAKDEFGGLDARLLSWQLVALVEVAMRPYSRKVLGDPAAVAQFVVTMFFNGITALEPAAEAKQR